MVYKNLVVFEGLDKSGKTTHSKKLILNLLNDFEIEALPLREPGATKVSEYIRNMLLSSTLEMHPDTELLLYSASRAELINKKIIPLLNDNKKVILDRFYYSTIAYQIYGNYYGANEFRTKLLNAYKVIDFSINHMAPSLIFYMRIPISELAVRMGHADRIEQRDYHYFSKVISGYDKMAKNSGWITIDSTKPMHAVENEIYKHIKDHWGLK